MNMTRRCGLIIPFALLTLTGCFSLSRDAEPVRQYVLSGAAVTEAGATLVEVGASSRDLSGLMIGVRRLDLSPYLATPSIVVRRGAHQVVHSELHRWSEEPGQAINRAVAGYLAVQAPFGAVDVAPWPVRSRYDYLVQLHVSRFEGVEPEEASAVEGEVHMLASWEIIRHHDGEVLARGGTDYRQPGWRVGDYAGLVAMLDRGLLALARDLTSSLGGLASATSPQE
jgi:uncharacterized lipoprotein YmbA